MPLRKPSGTPPIKRCKDEPTDLAPLRTLEGNNDKQVQEKGLELFKMAKESGDSGRYLHKKFKKVATLEDSSPKKEKDYLYLVPSEESENSSGSVQVRPCSPTNGNRYVCHYCKLVCAKPSVLQKHIRAHTNERPFPCLPCGFAFKTKSNLYKHCRSRAHTLKMDGSEDEEEEDEDCDKREVSNKPYKPKFHLTEVNGSEPESPFSLTPSPDLINVHISKLITENQAIVSDFDWPKDPRNGDSKLALALTHSLKDDSEPLNLTIKEPKKRQFAFHRNSNIQEFLMKSELTRINEEILHPCPHCKVVFRTEENLKTHLFSCRPKPSPGPLLGKTPLVNSFRDQGSKRRKIDRVKLFGGDVQIVETTEKSDQVLTISKTGLHSGGTIHQADKMEMNAEVIPIITPPQPLPLKISGMAPLHVPCLRFPPQSPNLCPLNNITAFNPLTLPPSNGLITILHGGKAIPFVPGMPGPNSLLSTSPQPKTPTPPSVIKPVPPAKPPPSEPKEDPKDVPPKTSVEIAPERKFLRPSSLPLKPGTYTPKRPLLQQSTASHSLISPETPRPRKSYGQLYLNGHAYTYLGLKCSTRMFFCTLNKPQPIYVPLSPDQYKVSMYSNWTICSESCTSPPGLDNRRAMSCYDSRNRNCAYTLANRKQDLVTHSSYRSTSSDEERTSSVSKNDDGVDSCGKKVRVCEGGFESTEEYTYIRGRGRGRYVCQECGIRCKKPSMLKKHIRTHTNLRPFACKYCSFSFKTKGNLTKHLKSKAHFKKCVELDLNPVPTSIDSCILDLLSEPGMSLVAGNEDESDEESEDEEDDDEDETDEEEDCRTEREVARSLLSLSKVTLETAHRQYLSAGLVAYSSSPRTYPYSSVSPCESSPQPDWDQSKVNGWRVDSLSLSQVPCKEDVSSPPDLPVRPIDLSNKALGSPPALKPLRPPGVPPLEKVAPDHPEESQLLHAYLTERTSSVKQVERPRDVDEVKKKPEERRGDEADIEGAAGAAAAAVVAAETSSVTSPTSPLAVRSPPHQSSFSPAKSPTSPSNRKLKAEFMPPSSAPALSYISSTEDGKSICNVCNKIFNKPSQLRLHVNIHYFERPFRCDSCAVSFRTKGHLQKHQRSLSHLNKVNMNSTFGAPTTSNPRPFKCDDCKIAFRIHGHLAKHFRSKMHIMKLECLGKLPFGTYAELERSGINMNDIDTTDCENSLESLQILAQKLYEKDPSKLSGGGLWTEETSSEGVPSIRPGGENSSGIGSSDEDPGLADLPNKPSLAHRPVHSDDDAVR